MQYVIIIMEGSKTLFCSSDFPLERERIYSKFINNYDTPLQKGSPTLIQ